MQSIAFIDTEIEPGKGKILDIGSVKADGSTFHSNSVGDFIKFIKGSQYICGHNIFHHDLKYIHDAVNAAHINESSVIDTLYLSHCYFPGSHIMLLSRTINCKLNILIIRYMIR